MLKEQLFKAGPVAINYAEGPDNGPPLVLLHGITSRWQTFLPLLPGLMARHHVYALDHRGHGKSGRAAGTYRLPDYGADAIAFLNGVVEGKAVVFGHSLGAMTTIFVAAQAREKVSAAVLEDPPLMPSRAHGQLTPMQQRFAAYRDMIQKGMSRQAMLQELRRLIPADDDAAHRFRISSICMLDADVVTSALEGRSREGYDPEALLKRIERPVLLLQGNSTLGGVLPDADAAKMASWLKDCTLVRFGDVGHQIHTDFPERTLKTVTNFLESL